MLTFESRKLAPNSYCEVGTLNISLVCDGTSKTPIERLKERKTTMW